MRAFCLAMLWLSLACFGGFWFWGELVTRQKINDELVAVVALQPDQFGGVLSYPPGKTASDVNREFDAASKHKATAYVMWRDSSLFLFAVLLCSAAWVTLSPPNAPEGQRRRILLRGSILGAIVSAVLFGLIVGNFGILGEVYAHEYEWVVLQNTILVGFVAGAALGTAGGGLVALLTLRSPAADPNAYGNSK